MKKWNRHRIFGGKFELVNCSLNFYFPKHVHLLGTLKRCILFSFYLLIFLFKKNMVVENFVFQTHFFFFCQFWFLEL